MLARREGAGSHDSIMAAFQDAEFTPKITHTPSLIGTVLQYVEAGAGIGIVPESVEPDNTRIKLLPLKPFVTIPLVMVWASEGDDPAVKAFREMVKEWLRNKKL